MASAGVLAGRGEPRGQDLRCRISYLVVREGEEFLPQAISIFPLPLLRQESSDLIAAVYELVPVSPDGVRCVGELNGLGISTAY